MLAFLQTFAADLCSALDPEVTMAFVIVFFSTALTLSLNQQESPTNANGNAEESTLTYSEDRDIVPEPTEIAQQEMSQLTTDIKSSLDNDSFMVVESTAKKPKKMPSFRKLIKQIKNRKEARVLKQSRSSVLKSMKRKSFSDHFRSLNPLKSRSKNLLTRSKSFTVAQSSSLLGDQSIAGKSV